MINNVYHTAYHKTTVHSNKTPCVTRCRLTSQYTLPAEYNSDRKSVSGFVITIGRVPTSWGSRKQTAIAPSTTEAEYARLSEAPREVTWIRNLCESLGHKQRTPTLISQDNVGSIGWANRIGKFARSKHIYLRMHHIQTLVQDKATAPVQVPTGAMEADIKTKPLAGELFRESRDLLRVTRPGIARHRTVFSNEKRTQLKDRSPSPEHD
jgi:hypothetical protein